MTRELTELRAALIAYLWQQPGRSAPAAIAVHEVARTGNVHISYVTAAMWTLVDEGRIRYGRPADLTLRGRAWLEPVPWKPPPAR